MRQGLGTLPEVARLSLYVHVLAFTAVFMAICVTLLWWIFRTGYRLKP